MSTNLTREELGAITRKVGVALSEVDTAAQLVVAGLQGLVDGVRCEFTDEEREELRLLATTIGLRLAQAADSLGRSLQLAVGARTARQSGGPNLRLVKTGG